MNITKTLDAKGLACPMPIVRTKKTIDTINSGEVLEVLVTDKGALNDFAAWAKCRWSHNFRTKRRSWRTLLLYSKSIIV